MEEFEKIAEEAVRKAEKVPVSLEDFKVGLEAMISHLKQRVLEVEGEL
jgi:hypothetical protein